MAKKIILLIFLITNYYLLITPSFAQNTCDLCGFCEGGIKPPDYDKCVSCLYSNPGPPPTALRSGVSFTVIGCLPTSPAAFIQKVLELTTAIAGGISFLLLLFGGFKILTSAGDPVRLASGKSLVISSIAALLLILFAVFLLRFIGFEILRIPGFGS